jgi:hypothetical protein
MMIWCRLRKKRQSVDLTPPRSLPVIKPKDPVTPQNQNRSYIGGRGGVSMSREVSSTPSHVSGVQSPTLPGMAFSLCVVFFIFYFLDCLLLLLTGKEINI